MKKEFLIFDGIFAIVMAITFGISLNEGNVNILISMFLVYISMNFLTDLKIQMAEDENIHRDALLTCVLKAVLKCISKEDYSKELEELKKMREMQEVADEWKNNDNG